MADYGAVCCWEELAMPFQKILVPVDLADPPGAEQCDPEHRLSSQNDTDPLRPIVRIELYPQVCTVELSPASAESMLSNPMKTG